MTKLPDELEKLKNELQWQEWVKIVKEIKFNDDFTPIRQLSFDRGFNKGFEYCFEAMSKSYVEKSKVDEIVKEFNELIKACEWYANNGTEQERHHFLAVEARGNFGQAIQEYEK